VHQAPPIEGIGGGAVKGTAASPVCKQLYASQLLWRWLKGLQSSKLHLHPRSVLFMYFAEACRPKPLERQHVSVERHYRTADSDPHEGGVEGNSQSGRAGGEDADGDSSGLDGGAEGRSRSIGSFSREEWAHAEAQAGLQFYIEAMRTLRQQVGPMHTCTHATSARVPDCRCN
jgi:hypothetical protein